MSRTKVSLPSKKEFIKALRYSIWQFIGMVFLVLLYSTAPFVLSFPNGSIIYIASSIFTLVYLIWATFFSVYRLSTDKLHDPILFDTVKSTVEEIYDRKIIKEAADQILYFLGRDIQGIVLLKQQRFLNIPSISFHYANHSQIKDFYDEYFKEPTIESLVSEIVGETDGNIKGSLPQVIEASIASKDVSKWVSNIKVPDISSSGMFLRYQRETIKRNQVTLGIEVVDIELEELQELEAKVEELQNRFGLTIDKVTLDNKKTLLKEKAAEKTLIKLEITSGWVIIEGKFHIELNGDFYKCTYFHPVNNYISSQITPITISMIIPIKSLEEHIKGNYAQSVGKSIPLTVYGNVWQPINRQSETWDLQVTPLAVY